VEHRIHHGKHEVAPAFEEFERDERRGIVDLT